MNKQSKKGLVPALRFPEFCDTGDWKFKPLKKLAKRCTEKNRDGKIVRVLTNSAEHGIVNQRDYFDKDIAIQGNLKDYFIVEKGDFVYNPRISSLAPVGPISKNNIATGVMSPLYTVFRFKIKNNDFYSHFFKASGWHQYMRQVSSTGARHDRMAISKDDFLSMPLPCSPGEAEQQKIADCLSSLDELIAVHTQKHQALQLYKKGLMQNLFPVEGETIPALRFPEFEDKGEWTKKLIGDICETYSGGTPSSSVKKYYGGEIPFIRSAEINKDDTELFLSREGLLNSSAKMVSQGDILYALYGANSGEVAIAKIEGAINQAILCLKHKESNNFIYQFLLFNKNNIINKYIQGGQGNLSGYIIKSIEILLPSTEEQQRVVKCLSPIDDLIAAQAKKIEELKSYKKGLMQKLFPVAGEMSE